MTYETGMLVSFIITLIGLTFYYLDNKDDNNFAIINFVIGSTVLLSVTVLGSWFSIMGIIVILLAKKLHSHMNNKSKKDNHYEE